MNTKKIKYKPDPAAIKALFNETGLVQKNLISEAYKFKLKFSLRQYQRAAEGQELKEEVLNSIAIFFDLYLKENKNSKRNISLNDILKKEKNVDNFNLNESNSKLIDLKKYEKENLEKCYLHRIESHEQITKIIKQSQFPKIFYPFNPNFKQINLIKKILEDFKSISKSFKRLKKESSETYENLGEEISSLDIISGFSSNIEELKKEGVYLYSNNFIFSSIHIAKAWTEDVYEMFVMNTNYAIFCFQNFKNTSITFEYENSYPKKYLEEFVKKNPLELDVSYPEAAANEQMHEHCYPYFENKGDVFDRSKMNLNKTDVSELLTDEEFEKIGEEYKTNEIENMYDDSFDPRD